MTNYRQTMESGPYKSFQLGEYHFQNVNINQLLIERIYEYLESGKIKPDFIHTRKEKGVIYKIHGFSNYGYRLIEIDATKNIENIGDGTNYIKSYPALKHGIITGNNKIYFIVSHSQESSQSEHESIMKNIQTVINGIRTSE